MITILKSLRQLGFSHFCANRAFRPWANIQQTRGIRVCAVQYADWKLGKVNHVAVACSDLDKAVSLYRDVLKANVSDIETQTEHGVYTVFVELGDTKIELLHPLNEKSPIMGFLEKNKSGGMHHICLEVDNIEEAMKDLRSKNIRLLSKESQIGAHGKPVVFLHPKDTGGVLIELEQT